MLKIKPYYILTKKGVTIGIYIIYLNSVSRHEKIEISSRELHYLEPVKVH